MQKYLAPYTKPAIVNWYTSIWSSARYRCRCMQDRGILHTVSFI